MKKRWMQIGISLTLSLLGPWAQAWAIEDPSSDSFLIGQVSQELADYLKSAPVKKRHIYTLEPHKGNHMLILHQIAGDPSVIAGQDQELHFQFSIKKNLISGPYFPLYFAFSQRSWWQVFDGPSSRPFRENNYNPEFFLYWEGRWIFDDILIGLWEHQSNGETTRFDETGTAVNFSRSWDRSYLQAKWSSPNGRWWTEPKVWNIWDSGKESLADNPDIHDYHGPGQLRAGYYETGLRIEGFWRYGVKGGLTSQLDLKWSHRCFSEGVLIHAYLFNGYGESLIDYNRHLTKIGLGFSLE
ncbi:MAG: hypothetical protein A2527_09765 [Candidatus Lambdaproteobacteria bacterium RIFOXYD2_FULL_50_16]|uniref:Phospholipase A1 n=1 Tax=Candidatus Lambdaproteobacteria bacterium RIFOXYD2_FULL_50_16 TaxID=1817772 RepID=A0A1F6G7N4_9PROT|nr:MAG: hypothetical protein A2527_09765 [Candidatus Lambdaproteobacteria bacterium RIFOXYD2_FULL_50_16]